MSGLRNRGAVVWLAAAMLAGVCLARAAEGPGWLGEADLQKGREALFQKRYADAARLCTTVYLEDPANAAAKRCLREAARAGASGDIISAQEEAGKIMKTAAESRRVSELIEQRRFLKAYELLYGALEADISDSRARGQLKKLQRAVDEETRGGLGLQDERSREAVLGFYEMTKGKWPDVLRAREHLLAALGLTGASIPEVRIRRYLTRIERQETRRGGASSQSVSAGPLMMKENYKELDELLK